MDKNNVDFDALDKKNAIARSDMEIADAQGVDTNPIQSFNAPGKGKADEDMVKKMMNSVESGQ